MKLLMSSISGTSPMRISDTSQMTHLEQWQTLTKAFEGSQFTTLKVELK